MKGTVFQRPLEFNLQVEGETWAQGDVIKGVLVVKNHGNEPASLADVRVRLALGKLSKVRQKVSDAFKIVSTAAIVRQGAEAPVDRTFIMDPNGVVQPGGEASFEWKFQTDRNCPITDNLSSLFLVYGRGEATDVLGALQLAVQPHSLIRMYLDALNIEFRFIPKGQKASKGRVEAKFDPPSSQNYASLESAVLFFRFEGENLVIDYVFNVKKIEANAASFEVQKKAKELTHTITPRQYLNSSGQVDHGCLEESIKDALSTVAAKILF